MRRRDFLVALVAVSTAEVALAQQLPYIGVLHSGFPNRTAAASLLFDELRRLGYENGRTARIDLLQGEGNPERLKSLAAELAAQKPAVVIAITSPAAFALKQAGTTSPVVFSFVSDPVGMGLVQSL